MNERRQFLFWLCTLIDKAYGNEASQPASRVNEASQPAPPVNKAFYKFAWLDLRTEKYFGQVAKGLPGSLAKIIAIAALVEENLISINQVYECQQKIISHQKTYTCQIPHHKVNLIEALALSCNIAFVQMAQKLPFEIFKKYFYYFTNISLKSALSPTENYILGLSPDLSLNSQQILKIMSLIASKGKGQRNFSEVTWQVLQNGLRLAAQKGTAKKLDMKNILQIAAKTGTIPHGNKFESWVAGYFPFEKPKYCFCLKSFNGTSQDSAIPLAHYEIFKRQWL